MYALKVVKFGGSSLASGKQLQKVFDIVTADPARKAVVVSAPGKRHSTDTKVTDLLISCGEQYLRLGEAHDLQEAVIERYASIADELGLGQDIIDTIRQDVNTLLQADSSHPERYLDAIKASGEDNNAKLIAAYFQHQGVEAHYVNPKKPVYLSATSLVKRKSFQNRMIICTN